MADYELKGTVMEPKDNETMKKLTDMYSKYMMKTCLPRQIMISTCDGPSHIEMMARACGRVFLRSLYDEYVLKEEKPIDIDKVIGRRARHMSIDEFKRNPIEPDTTSIEVIKTADSEEIRKRVKEYLKKNTVVIRKIPEEVREKAERDAVLHGDSFVAVNKICGYPLEWIDGIEDQTIGRRGRR